MAASSDLGARVQAQLDDFLASRRSLLADIGAETGPLLDEAAAVLAGGKRLRPAFCLAGWRAAGGDPDDERVLRAAASLELLHAGALLHDDLIDRSDTRRGRPAAHRALAQQHRSAGWRGEPNRFGTGAALLLGDLLLGWAPQMLRGCGLSAEAVNRAVPWFEAATTEVIAGQYLDLVAQAMATSSEDIAWGVVRHKSASYTVVRPLHLGAALGGGDDHVLAVLGSYGESVGMAFQLRDDVLGIFGDPDRTGKPAGDDLREGKRTVLLARAVEHTDDSGRALVDRLVGDPELDDAGLRRLRTLIVDSGALASVERTIVELEAAALATLDQLPGTAAGARADLTELAAASARRAT